MKEKISLYRKRFIPNETVHLKDDFILVYQDDLIITKWKTLKPRPDTARGISAYFMDKNIKVSKIYDKDDNLVYWYCDIVHYIKNPADNSIVIEDLLADVIIYPDGHVKVVDIGEIADALEAGLIPQSLALQSLRTLDSLLETIYSGYFHTLQQYINEIES